MSRGSYLDWKQQTKGKMIKNQFSIGMTNLCQWHSENSDPSLNRKGTLVLVAYSSFTCLSSFLTGCPGSLLLCPCVDPLSRPTSERKVQRLIYINLRRSTCIDPLGRKKRSIIVRPSIQYHAIHPSIGLSKLYSKANDCVEHRIEKNMHLLSL